MLPILRDNQQSWEILSTGHPEDVPEDGEERLTCTSFLTNPSLRPGKSLKKRTHRNHLPNAANPKASQNHNSLRAEQ